MVKRVARDADGCSNQVTQATVLKGNVALGDGSGDTITIGAPPTAEGSACAFAFAH